MFNVLTIDLEDYFQVHVFSRVIKFEDWDKYESRIERNTHRLLEILQGSGIGHRAEGIGSELTPNHSGLAPHGEARATFFVLGWLAERYPKLIKEIHNHGHEIACHGYAHRLISNQSKDEFKNDVRKSKAILEDITGEEVVGYRAPSYSITQKSQWALEVLAEEGFKYDSSIFPIHHDLYGMPEAPRFPFIISLNGGSNNGTLIEFPISTVRFAGLNFPISGGGYFRLFPYAAIKRGLERINRVEGMPFIFYIHPWEIDPDQPRINSISRKSRFRHYVNLYKTESKFKKLLTDFDFCSIKELLELDGSINSITQVTQ